MSRLRYRLITGSDDAQFCERISALMDEGYILHGTPQVSADGGKTICAQALILPDFIVERERDG